MRLRTVPRSLGAIAAAHLWAVLVIGCTTGPPPISGAVNERSEAMALAWELLNENKDVGGILAIKSVTPATRALIEEIASSCRRSAKAIEEVARSQDLSLEDDGLPTAERRVRAAIRAARTRELLLTFGSEFERSLVLAQIEAMGYASALLQEVADQLGAAASEEVVRRFEADATHFGALRGRAIGRLELVPDEDADPPSEP